MEILLSFIFGAVVAVAGYLVGRGRRKPTRPPTPDVNIQGGGPGNTPPPPSNGGDE